MKEYVIRNQRLRTKPGDDDSAQYLRNLKDKQSERLEFLINEMARIKKRLDQLEQ